MLVFSTYDRGDFSVCPGLRSKDWGEPFIVQVFSNSPDHHLRFMEFLNWWSFCLTKMELEMKKLFLLTAIAVSSCSPPPPSFGIKDLGSGLYEISGMQSFGGSVTSRAARYCQSLENKTVNVVSNTTQIGVYSGTNYPILLFKCE